MRTLSVEELELVVGGYDNGQGQVSYEASGSEYEVTATGLSAADTNAIETMSSSDLNTYANQTAANFGINVGPFVITPITPLNPSGGIQYGVKAKARC